PQRHQPDFARPHCPRRYPRQRGPAPSHSQISKHSPLTRSLFVPVSVVLPSCVSLQKRRGRCRHVSFVSAMNCGGERTGFSARFPLVRQYVIVVARAEAHCPCTSTCLARLLTQQPRQVGSRAGKSEDQFTRLGVAPRPGSRPEALLEQSGCQPQDEQVGDPPTAWPRWCGRWRRALVRPAIHVAPPPGDVGPHRHLKALEQAVIPTPSEDLSQVALERARLDPAERRHARGTNVHGPASDPIVRIPAGPVPGFAVGGNDWMLERCPSRPAVEFNRMKADEVPAVCLKFAHPMKSRSGLRKIPPPTPVRPETKPSTAPHPRAATRHGSTVVVS